MTSKGFIFLLLVTIATVMIAGSIAEQFFEVGLQRTLVVAVVTALVMFPIARWAEKRGWVKGSVRIDKLGEEFKRPGRGGAEATEKANAAKAAAGNPAPTPANGLHDNSNQNNSNFGDKR